MASDHDEGEERGAFRWWFEDRSSGRIVVGQVPNLPLWIFAAAWTANKFIQPAGIAGRALPWIASASLTIWSLDEIARGVNPWRRTLGASVLAAEAFSWFRR